MLVRTYIFQLILIGSLDHMHVDACYQSHYFWHLKNQFMCLEFAACFKTSLYAKQLPCAKCNQHKCCKSVSLYDLHNYFSELGAKTI